MNDAIPILIVAAIIVVSMLLVIMFLQNLLIVVPPNKMLVISGRSRQTAEGDMVGYRVIWGGRAFRGKRLLARRHSADDSYGGQLQDQRF